MGWTDDFDLAKCRFSSNDRHLIYVYLFTDLHAAYVGQTIERRKDARHREHGTDPHDSVCRFITERGIDLPEMRIIADGLSSEDARMQEDFHINEYRKDGWDVINIRKGGSLGGGSRRWTEDAIKKEASKYSGRNEFKKGCNSAYDGARRLGIMDELFPGTKKTHPRNYWDDENNIRKAASKCNSRGEFRLKFSRACYHACKNGIIDELFPIERKWTFEAVKMTASKYSGRNEFRKGCNAAYQAARRLGIMDELFPFHAVNRHFARPVAQFSTDGTFIARYDSLKAAADSVEGCNINGISHCCRKTIKSHHGYIWRYADDVQAA